MRYLVAMWEGGGTVPVELGVVRRLRKRGHEVVVLADPSLEEGVRAAGGAFRSWRLAPHIESGSPPDNLLRDWECRTPVAVFRRLLDRLVTGPAGLFAADVRAAVAEEPVDAAAVDGALLGALIGTESLGVPTAALVPGAYPLPAPGIPAFGPGLRPARGPLGRTRDALLNGAARRLWASGLPALNAARADLGLPRLDQTWGQLDRVERVLVLTSQAFDFPGRLPANVRYVGPVLDDAHWVRDGHRPPSGPEPLVLVGVSTAPTKGALELLRRVVAGLELADVRAVVATGPAIDPAQVADDTVLADGRIHVVPSAPHAALLPQASAMVTHAGHGTIIKALAAGVPVLCTPLGRDQYDNSVRASARGAGIKMRATSSPQRIAAGLRRLLDEPSFRVNAEAMGARIRADAESGALVSELEGLVGAGRRAG